MRRYNIIFVILFAVVAGACVSPSVDTSTESANRTARPTLLPKADQVIVTFGAYDSQRPLYEPLINAFNAEHADVYVQFVSLDSKTFISEDSNQVSSGSQALRQIASAADTAATSVDTDAIATGYLTNLAPFMDADQAFNRADYFPSALGGFHLEDGVYVLPRVTNISLLSYNKRLWTETGLPEPGPNTSWSDLVAAAEQMARKSGNTVDAYGLIDGQDGFTVFLSELEQAGINVLSIPADEVQFEQPEIVAVAQHVRSLVDSGAVYTFKQEGGDIAVHNNLAQLVRDQRVAVWAGLVDPNDPSIDFEIGTFPMPLLTQPPYVFGQEGYVMSSGARNPDAAWRWLSWLSRQPVFTPDEQNAVTIYAPARRSLAELTGYWTRTDAETAAAARIVVERPAQTPLPLPDERISSSLSHWQYYLMGGPGSVEEALSKAQESLGEAMARSTDATEESREQEPVVVATPRVIPEGAAAIMFLPYGLDQRRVARIAEAFTRDNPSIVVDVRRPQEDAEPQRFAAAAAQSDCFAWPSAPTTEQITATLDLQSFADADAAFDLADFPGGLLAPFKRSAALYGLPHTVDLRTLNYNRVAFERAGLTLPDATWTLDDFRNAAQQLTRAEAGAEQYGYVLTLNRPDDILFFLNQFDASLVIGRGNELQPDFTNPRVVAALRYVIDVLRAASPYWELPGYNAPEMGEATVDQSWMFISQGKAGMWLDTVSGAGFYDSEQRNESFAPAIAPPPTGSARLSHTDVVRMSGLYISAGTAYADACRQWITYLSGEVPSFHNSFPARTSVAESNAFLAQSPDGAVEVYAAYRDALQSTPDAPTFSNQLDLFWFYRAVDRALQGADLERELHDAQFLTKQYLACVRGGEHVWTCATTVDAEYDGFAAE
jgi:ABC-type glycerol-3-phosphate transport system substrate-binding protein